MRVILEDIKSYVQRGLLELSVGDNALDARTVSESSPDITQVFRPPVTHQPK